MASRFWTQGDSESEEEESEIEEEENAGGGEAGDVAVGSKYLQKKMQVTVRILMISVGLSDLQRTRGSRR